MGEFCPLAHNCSSSTEFDPNGSISFRPTGLQTVVVDLKVQMDASFQSVGTGVHLPTDPKLLLLIPVNSCACLCGNISQSKRIVNTNRNECIAAKKRPRLSMSPNFSIYHHTPYNRLSGQQMLSGTQIISSRSPRFLCRLTALIILLQPFNDRG